MGTKIISKPLNRSKINRDPDLRQYYLDLHNLIEEQVKKSIGKCTLVGPRQNKDDLEWEWMENPGGQGNAEITARTNVVDRDKRIVTTLQSTIDVHVPEEKGDVRDPAYATWFSLIIPKRDMKQIEKRCRL